VSLQKWYKALVVGVDLGERGAMTSRFFSVAASTLWNKLSANTKPASRPTFVTFKFRLKTELFTAPTQHFWFAISTVTMAGANLNCFRLNYIKKIGHISQQTSDKGRPQRAWRNDIKHWTNLSTDELLQSTKNRAAWRTLVCRDANVRTRRRRQWAM